MEPLLIGLIKELSIETLKILGPAIVATVATYKATKIQYESKLIEIEAKNGFGARQKLFDYYKHRQERLAENQKSLSDALGQILGISTAISSNEDSTQNPMLGLLDLAIRLAPFEIETTIRDMKAKGLENSEEFRKLANYKSTSTTLKTSENLDIIKSNIFFLMEIYVVLEACNQILLEKQMENLFSVYMKSSKATSKAK